MKKVELTQQIEQAKKETKELNKNFAIQLGIALEKKFARTDAKVKDKVEKLVKELEIIASRKQNYGK